MNRFRATLPFISLALCAMISFRTVLLTDGIVGYTWDWGSPSFPEQFQNKALSGFFSWHSNYETGRYIYFQLEIFYWLLFLPISFFGGEFFSKAVPIIILFTSGCGAYLLARKGFALTAFFSTLAGLFYMLSPYAYSRIIAGHLPLLFGYAILPIIILNIFYIIDTLEKENKIPIPAVISCGLLVWLQSVHPSIGLNTLVIIGIISMAVCLRTFYWKKLLASISLVLLIATLANSYWIGLFVEDRLTKDVIRHGWGLSASADKDVTDKSEIELRESFLRSTSQPAYLPLSLRMQTGMSTEYVFPVPNGLHSLHYLVSIFLILSIPLSLYLAPQAYRKKICAFCIIGLLGISLVIGLQSVVGYTLYKIILKNFLPIVFMAMSNSGRWFLLIVLACSILGPYVLQKINDRFLPKGSWAYKGLTILLAAIFVSPFLFGKLTEPVLTSNTQPLSLLTKKIHKEEREVFNFLRDKPEDFRVTYLPPAFLSWPGHTDLSYEWTTTYSPKNAFLATDAHPLGQTIAKELYSKKPSPYVARLLGLASVKYIIYPNYEFFISYKDFQKDWVPEIIVEGYKDYKPILDRNWSVQRGLRRVGTFKAVQIYENGYYVPRIYIPNHVILAKDFSFTFKNFDVNDPWFQENIQPVFISTERQSYLAKEAILKFLTHAENLGLKDRQIKYTRANPSRYLVEIRQGKQPFLLIFNETFNPSWKAYLYEGTEGMKESMSGFFPRLSNLFFRANLTGELKEIPTHFMANGYGNGWVIPSLSNNTEGHVTHMVIEFQKQRVYELGLLISFLTLFSSMTYLLLYFSRRKWRK